MDIELPDGALVLVDSSALVYLVEGEEGSPRRKAVESFFAEAAARAWTVIASTLIWKELLEKPLATEQGELAARYRRAARQIRRAGHELQVWYHCFRDWSREIFEVAPVP